MTLDGSGCGLPGVFLIITIVHEGQVILCSTLSHSVSVRRINLVIHNIIV